MPETKRFEYRFKPSVFDNQLAIVKEVQYSDPIVKAWLPRAYYVFDHLTNRIIKDSKAA